MAHSLSLRGSHEHPLEMSVLAITPIIPKSYIVRIISFCRYESTIVPEPQSERESRRK